jgi:hypothetical protein
MQPCGGRICPHGHPSLGFVGLTLALLTGYQLQIFGLVTLVPPAVSVSFNSDDKKEMIVLPFVSNLRALACAGLQLSVADT